MYSNFYSKPASESSSDSSANKPSPYGPGRGNPAIFGSSSNYSNGPKPSPYGPGRGNPAIFGASAVSSSTPSPAPYGARPSMSSGSAPSAASSNPQASLRKITLDELSDHDTATSLWIAYKGYVYDATDYKHSGGAQALQRGAGKDATQMIARQHSWVKVDEILKSKRIGVLVVENYADDSDDD